MSSQHHNTSPHENEHTVFDTLIPPIEKLSDCFNGLHRQFDKLKQVNDNLVEFNDSFSAFLFGLAANDTTVKWRSLTTESDITKHKKYLNQLHTHEATKAVQVVTQPTHPSPLPTTTHTTTAATATTTSATALPSSSTSATALPRPVHKRNAIANLPGNTRKKPKTVKEIPKQLVSNRRFEPKVNVKNIINRLPIKYQDRGVSVYSNDKTGNLTHMFRLATKRAHVECVEDIGITSRRINRQEVIIRDKTSTTIHYRLHQHTGFSKRSHQDPGTGK
ncbi:hypothetical protein G6F42_024030 [Rhizopus arrhizus]|nr:hypothetical protein G6F42_024030 [Rhizopus arrhizus]